MAANGQAQPTLIQSGAGKPIDFGSGRGASVLLDGEQTGGTLAMLLVTLPPGFGPPPHVHSRDDEIFLVAEGIISYFHNGTGTDVGPGGVIYFPKGTPHGLRNNGTTPARH